MRPRRFSDRRGAGLEFCYVYIDDILVASSSAEEYHHHQQEIKFLGYMVSGEGTRPLPERVKAIQEYRRPDTVRNLRRYLGMINFYRRFLPRAAETLAPLNDLLVGNTRGRTPVAWIPRAQRAFEASRESLAQAALLAHPRIDAELALFTDASDHSVGATIQQRGKEDGWEPLAFYSKRLSSAESKYSACDRELLAIYLAVTHYT